MNKRRVILILLGAIILMALIGVIGLLGKKEEKASKKIGYIMTGSGNESGWNQMHYEGIRNACDAFSVELCAYENVLENSGVCRDAVKELIEQDIGLIILSSYNYTGEVMDYIVDNPQIAFYQNSDEYHNSNLSTYSARMYQARYLSGIMAGMQTKTNKIGYVAAMSNSEVNRGISAFTLGVQSVNSDATVIVSWTGDWDNMEAEQLAAQTLISEAKVDVITYHQNQPYVAEVAEEYGCDYIGYHTLPKQSSEHCLACIKCDWSKVYETIIRDYLVGRANESEICWIGMEKGAVMLSDYSSKLSKECITKVEQEKEQLCLKDNIFARYLVDQNGIVRCEENEGISDKELLESFDWLVEGIEIYEN